MSPRHQSKTPLLLLLLAGLCLLAPLAATAQFPGLDKVIQVTQAQREWTLAEEQAIGQATAAKMVAVLGLYENPAMVKYVNLVGRSVSQFAGRPDLGYHFGILDTEIVNAFATPGGYIFVTRGLLANVNTEAELAGVLAHEVAHASERHLEKELRTRKLAGVGTEAATEQATAGAPISELSEVAQKIASAAVDTLLAGKLSRDKEKEADTKGVELVAAAGYDPTAYEEFLNWLGEASGQAENRRALGILTASHPKYSDRVAQVEKLIKKQGWSQEERPRLAERYQENTDFSAPPPAPVEAPVEVAAATTEAAAATEVATPTAAAEAPVKGAEAETPEGMSGPGAAERAAGETAVEKAASADSSEMWGFHLQPFSADMVTTHGKRTMRAKLYARPQAFRMEMQEQGTQVIMIMRFDRQVVWMLMPPERMVMEQPLQPVKDFTQAAMEPDAQVDREFLGVETAGPYLCRKYRVRVTHRGESYTGLQWSADELNGFVVKMMDEKSGATVEYQNINLGAPDASLFEIPPGYSKMTMPGLR
jgi:Zn-dependent protease with chaperone function/outer membrane lipoprotein-sorting protein